MSRLDEHRRQLHLNERQGPLLSLDELTADEVATVNATFFEKVRTAESVPETIDEMYALYLSALCEWGVMCPHPAAYRRGEEGRWYDCTLCKAAVIRT